LTNTIPFHIVDQTLKAILAYFRYRCRNPRAEDEDRKAARRVRAAGDLTRFRFPGNKSRLVRLNRMSGKLINEVNNESKRVKTRGNLVITSGNPVITSLNEWSPWWHVMWCRQPEIRMGLAKLIKW
jgi:hypothetical protein